MTEPVVSLRDYLSGEIEALRREMQAADSNAERAAIVAAGEAAERLHLHNGLIEQMRQQATHFATREALDDFKDERHKALDILKDTTDSRFSRLEKFQAMIIGALLFVSAIGVANLVKVWTPAAVHTTPTQTVTTTETVTAP